ncbi:alpha/beta hydrolase [Streptomyces lasiicapitis]|uniref:alpha/beta hydrolase n=1 Tax=Streptomyces lasiicapitis TaxID=1923961 RepID=UPI003669B488
MRKKPHLRSLLALLPLFVLLLPGEAGAGGPSASAGGPSAAAEDAPASALKAAPDGARVSAERQLGPRLRDLTVSSPALGRDAKVRLLTPEGWERRQPRDRWPVLYLLVGGDGNHKAWTEDYASRVQELPQLRDVLVVMPEMPLFGFYTDWFNGGEGGPPAVETFHLDEVRPLLERGYGAGTRRVAAGESQGGFGALSYARRVTPDCSAPSRATAASCTLRVTRTRSRRG